MLSKRLLWCDHVDWNPAVDKQAAARCWRDGQKKRCFTYRFLATGTVEEKIFQRQLSKEGLQSVVDDKEQVNALSTKDLRNLFKLRTGTPSDTHDKLRCERCKIIQDDAEIQAQKVLPQKLTACLELVDKMFQHEDSIFFHKPLVPEDHGVSKAEYEKIVKQPMDLGTIRSRLNLSPDQASAYKSAAGVSKDVNRIFSNVIKVWSQGQPIADAAGKLQGWWIEEWTALVPRLMSMKADSGAKENQNTDEAAGDDLLDLAATVDNERGDDYQEQIGMPDEENMRSWSHHHSTDTVDDPIFRAAMRGCDAVSFVFGLEVTWSLIQQRQQEEEERLAMQELEAIQELQDEDEEDGDDNESNDDDEDGSSETEDSKEVATDNPSSPSKNEKDTKSSADDRNESMEDANEDDDKLIDSSASTQSDGSDGQVSLEAGEDEIDDDNESMNDESSSVDGNEEELEAQSPASPESLTTDTEKPTSDERTGAVDTDDTSPVSSTSSSSSSQFAEAESIGGRSSSDEAMVDTDYSVNASKSTSEWACPTCTLLNPKSRRKCTACGAKRPQAGTKRSIQEVQ